MTVLRKEKDIKTAFMNWDFSKVAEFGEREVEGLLKNPRIISMRKKCQSVIENAK